MIGLRDEIVERPIYGMASDPYTITIDGAQKWGSRVKPIPRIAACPNCGRAHQITMPRTSATLRNGKIGYRFVCPDCQLPVQLELAPDMPARKGLALPDANHASLKASCRLSLVLPTSKDSPRLPAQGCNALDHGPDGPVAPGGCMDGAVH